MPVENTLAQAVGRRPVRATTFGLISVWLALAGACTPQAETTVGQSREGASEAARVLRIAQRRPFTTFADFIGVGTAGGGNTLFRRIAHDYLTLSDEFGVVHPKLAVEVPSVERGTWRVNPDGTMDMQWKIRPNVKWHNGTPFTSADLLFAFQLHTDRDYNPTTGTAKIRLMESAAAPDPLALNVHWKQVVNDAHSGIGLDPMPKHLLEEMYRSDKELLTTTALLNSDFVGLGPYRIAEWNHGVETVFTRFDEYYEGKPPLDKLVVKEMGDPNVMVASILAGAIDAVVGTGMETETALEIRRQWEGTGNQVSLDIQGSRVRWVRIQHNPEYARVKNGLTLLPVRQAFYHAVDRQQFSEAHGQDLTPPADSWVRPDHPWRSQLETAIPQYPYNLAQALRMLEEVGWTRGPDGKLVHQSGERFDTVFRVRAVGGGEQDGLILQNAWSQIGAEIGIEALTPVLSQDRMYQAQAPFATLSSLDISHFTGDGLHSSQIGSKGRPGRNWGNYSNPRVDAVLDRILGTIDEREQISLYRNLLQEQLGDLAGMWLYWGAEPELLLKGVTLGWNPFLWTKG